MNEYFFQFNLRRHREMFLAMQNPATRSNQFKDRIRSLICSEPLRSRAIKLAKGAFLYTFGDQDALVYYLASGQIKLMVATPEGKECVLGIRFAGDIFGELCLSGRLFRTESAVALQESQVFAISYINLLNLLKSESLLENLVQYLAVCIDRQQETISSLISANSEQRLAKLLLQLRHPLASVIPWISHEDLASMIGTTRSRVGLFLGNFQKNGLIRLNADRSLTIDVSKLEVFVTKSAVPRTVEETCSNRPPQFAAASANLEIPVPNTPGCKD
jgi:CRP/FNR family transcriptional regulator, cyclic AMP receptor protein